MEREWMRVSNLVEESETAQDVRAVQLPAVLEQHPQQHARNACARTANKQAEGGWKESGVMLTRRDQAHRSGRG